MMKRMMFICSAIAIGLLLSLAFAQELPPELSQVPPSDTVASSPRELSFEEAVRQSFRTLEKRLSAVESGLSDVKKIANREYIAKVAGEICTARLNIRMSDGTHKMRTVTYAGLGTFEIPEGGSLHSVDNVVLTQYAQVPHQGQQAVFYQTPTTQVAEWNGRYWIRARAARAARQVQQSQPPPQLYSQFMILPQSQPQSQSN
jgi:hypothetical protein